MYSQRAMERIAVINKKISFIENIVRNKGTIIKARNYQNSHIKNFLYNTSLKNDKE